MRIFARLEHIAHHRDYGGSTQPDFLDPLDQTGHLVLAFWHDIFGAQRLPIYRGEALF
jgi:hypothetical protein